MCNFLLKKKKEKEKRVNTLNRPSAYIYTVTRTFHVPDLTHQGYTANSIIAQNLVRPEECAEKKTNKWLILITQCISNSKKRGKANDLPRLRKIVLNGHYVTCDQLLYLSF